MLQSNFYRILNTPLSHRIFVFKDSSEVGVALEVCKYKKYIDKRFPNFYALSDFRAKKGDDLRSYSLELGELLLHLARFYEDSNAILLTPIHTILNPLPKASKLRSIWLKKGEEVNFLQLKERLLCCGFEPSDLIHAPKEISIHGDIIDIFPYNLTNPIRISFFDNEIENIKYFDIVSQMCFGDELNEVEIFPALFHLSRDEFNKLDDLAKNSKYDAFIKDIVSLGFWFVDGIYLTQEFPALLSPSAKDELLELDDTRSEILQNLQTFTFDDNYSDIIADTGNVENLFALHKGKLCTLISLNELLLDMLDIPPSVNILKDDICLNIITPNELILSLNKINKTKKKAHKTLVLDELNIGDYVVHEDYGIGKFQGIVQTKILGNISDFIEIVYLNDDKLLLPTYNLHLLSKYIASGASLPIVDRLGKGSFAKIKDKIRPKLLEIAKEIIDIAAQRELIQGKVIDTTSAEVVAFKERSGFVLTDDQEKSIAEIFADLSSGKIMDRLLSGDVGFGKTEVAMNAMFASVSSGYQAALIVPTTLLANQHFESLKARFEGIKIAKLDRFTRNKQSIIKGIHSGEIKVVVGTHSLLNVKFDNLGLIVLDEEHKFGVKQKEQLKNLTKAVHILSMSATPIPRTLNMALSHIKTKSELNTPPNERIPPKTFVKNYDETIIKDAILRELRRNGQVFYIHNNIASITSKRDEILKLLPNLSIAILHSKIPPNESEEIMMKFAKGQYDMLLSTSIVESGIHLPNANTIIIDGADSFGIADLHQLRGRVGRGNKESFCYFFVDDKENLTTEAKRRLVSLETNSFLGSGGVLSYADLEIRGGGNILGEAQSGHIKNVGYSLYLKMLEESINHLSGKDIQSKQSVDIKLNISAYLQPSLIPSDRVRLDLYRRLSNAKSQAEVYEIEEEINNRFGKLDNYTLRFLQLILVKILANSLKIKKISNYNQHISVFYEDSKESFEASEIDDGSVLESLLVYLRQKIKESNA